MLSTIKNWNIFGFDEASPEATRALAAASPPAGGPQLLERIFTDVHGRQLRMVFMVAVVDGELKGKLVSVQPLSSRSTLDKQLHGTCPVSSGTICLPIECSHKKGETEYVADPGSTRRSRTTPNIPPYAENWKLTGITPVTEDITLYAMSPHMHLRGKSLKWVVTYPDGREQVILNVPKFDFNWQFNYELAEPLKIPAGSKITGIGVYDNSVRNKWNPGPQLPVYWSEQSWDEMYNPQIRWTWDLQDLTKKSGN